MRSSTSGSRRQLSIDKNNRHRGSDEGDAPLLLEVEGAPGEGDVVIGREEGNQAEREATNGLDQSQPVNTQGGDDRAGGEDWLRF